MQALKALASKAAGDVRSCLNTLQLLSARHDMVTGSHVSAVPVGDKDMTSAPFAVWGKLLSSRPPRPGDMLTHLMSFGEHDLVRCFPLSLMVLRWRCLTTPSCIGVYISGVLCVF